MSYSISTAEIGNLNHFVYWRDYDKHVMSFYDHYYFWVYQTVVDLTDIPF